MITIFSIQNTLFCGIKDTLFICYSRYLNIVCQTESLLVNSLGLSSIFICFCFKGFSQRVEAQLENGKLYRHIKEMPGEILRQPIDLLRNYVVKAKVTKSKKSKTAFFESENFPQSPTNHLILDLQRIYKKRKQTSALYLGTHNLKQSHTLPRHIY